MIFFEKPVYLYLLLIIPVILILHYLSLVTFKKRAMKFANFETIRRISGNKDIISKNIFQLLFRILFVLVLVLGIAGLSVTVKTQGLRNEIVLAVDTSGSMLASDVMPNRLDATKSALKEYIGNLSDEAQIGVISFTSLAYIEQKLTNDRFAVLSAIDRIKVRRTSGTSLGSAISTSASFFSDDEKMEKAIVIFTDGQENILSKEELVDVVDYVTSRNIRIFIVGIGSVTGGPIRNTTRGNSVINEGTIKLITDRNEGRFDLARSQDEIKRILETLFTSENMNKVINLSYWLYLLSFVLLIVEWYFSNYVGRSFP